MKIKEGFVLKEIDNNFIVVAIGEAVKTFNGMIQLNETSAFLWKLLESGKEEREMAEEFAKEYGVSLEIATNDVNEFIQNLKEANLLK